MLAKWIRDDRFDPFIIQEGWQWSIDDDWGHKSIEWNTSRSYNEKRFIQGSHFTGAKHPQEDRFGEAREY